MMNKIFNATFALIIISAGAFSLSLHSANAQIIGSSCPGLNFLLKPRPNTTTGSVAISVPQNAVNTVTESITFNTAIRCPGYGRLYYKWNKNSDPIDMNISSNITLFPNGTISEGKYEIQLQLADSKNFTDIYETKDVILTVTKSQTTPSTTGTGSGNSNGNTNGSGTSTGSSGGTVPNTNVSANIPDLDKSSGEFWNPLQIDTVPQLITGIIRILFLLIGIASVVIIIWSGFRMVLSNGNQQQYTAAKKAITWAVVGLVVSLLSFSIVAIVQRLIQIGA